MEYLIDAWFKKATPIQQEIKKIVAEFPELEATNVTHLIQCSENKYIIFIDSQYDLDWFAKDTVEFFGQPEFQKILGQIGVLKNKPAVNQMTKKMKLQFNCLLGTALATAFEGVFDSAKEVLEEAQNYLVDREYEITRGWIVQYSLGIFIGTLGILGLLHLFEQTQHICQQLGEVRILIFGMLGGVLSILQHNGKLSYTCSAGKKLVFLQIVSKVTISMLSAFLIAKAFEAEIIFGGLSSQNGVEAFKIILYIVAGFSERMVPSLIEKFESTEVVG